MKYSNFGKEVRIDNHEIIGFCSTEGIDIDSIPGAIRLGEEANTALFLKNGLILLVDNKFRTIKEKTAADNRIEQKKRSKERPEMSEARFR